MKYHILNFALLGLMVVPAWCAPRAKAPLANPQGHLIFQRGEKLEVLRSGKKTAVVLRNSFVPEDWSFSPDGTKLCFTEAPFDADFFNAGAWRSYAFTANYKARQKVFLAGYDTRKLKGTDSSYSQPQFSGNSQRIVLQEAAIGQFPEDYSGSWISIYDSKTRKQAFDSRSITSESKATGPEDLKSLSSLSLLSPALSSDGKDLVCLGIYNDGDSWSDVYPPGKKVPPLRIVHFDLSREKGEVLTLLEDELSVERTTESEEQITTTINGKTETKTVMGTRVSAPLRISNPQFNWHPTQKKFVFSGPVDPNTPGVNLFVFDLKAKKLNRLTNTPQDDICPQWSPDGKTLTWIRHERGADTNKDNQLMRANADGSNAQPILPQLKGISKIQIVPHLAPWENFKKIKLQAVIGKD